MRVQSCLTLCNPVCCIVHGILQTRILEWVAFPFPPRDLPNPGIEPRVNKIIKSWQFLGGPVVRTWCFPCHGPRSKKKKSLKTHTHTNQIYWTNPEWRRSAGEGIGYPLQYSGLENSMDYTVHGVSKSQKGLSDFHFHLLFSLLSFKEFFAYFRQ